MSAATRRGSEYNASVARGAEISSLAWPVAMLFLRPDPVPVQLQHP